MIEEPIPEEVSEPVLHIEEPVVEEPIPEAAPEPEPEPVVVVEEPVAVPEPEAQPEIAPVEEVPQVAESVPVEEVAPVVIVDDPAEGVSYMFDLNQSYRNGICKFKKPQISSQSKKHQRSADHGTILPKPCASEKMPKPICCAQVPLPVCSRMSKD